MDQKQSSKRSTATVSSRRVETKIAQLLRARAGRSICPSDVARALAPASRWRVLMPLVRDVAARLVARGEAVVTQRGKSVDARRARGPIRIALPPLRAAKHPAYADAYRGIDFRRYPERYRVGRGEQGVLIAEPYKSELLPLWAFKTPEVAHASAAKIWKTFLRYRRERDFVGMDMARKFLQMGFTRARRYANRRSGRKYDAAGQATPFEPDETKAASAAVFYEAWQRAERDRTYRAWREQQATATRKSNGE